MKHLIFILILALAPCAGFPQSAPLSDTAVRDSLQQDTLTDNGEAGGIDAADVGGGSNKDSMSNVLVGAVCMVLGLIIGFGVAGTLKKKPADRPMEPDSKLFIEEDVAADKEAGAGDIKKLRGEIRSLKQKLETANSEKAAYKKNLDIYTDFDQKYYNEAFRKLIAPMNDAMEKGSRKEILENLLKIMSHFSSLTRYKIAKKQAYDEPNMQYLMNQRLKNDVASEINGNTPVDKIPKNIKPLMDMLSEQSSAGLDDSIISGYKIKNL